MIGKLLGGFAELAEVDDEDEREVHAHLVPLSIGALIDVDTTAAPVALPTHPGGICHSAQHLAFILISHFNQSIKAAQQLVNHSKSAKCQSVGGRGEGGRRGAALGLTFNPTLNNHTHDRGDKF